MCIRDRRVRDFFDAIDAGAPPPVRLTTRLGSVEVRWSPAVREARRTAFQYRIARAIAHARTGSYAEAERQLVEVLRATPDAWLAWQNLALVQATTGRWPEALATLRQAAARDPANGGILALAQALDRAGAPVMQQPPNTPARTLAQCDALLSLHMVDAARRTLAPLLTTEPVSPEARALEARVNAALQPRETP